MLKKFSEKRKKQLARDGALIQEKYELKRTKKRSLKQNTAEIVLPDLEEFQENSERYWYVDRKRRYNYIRR